MKKQIIVSSLMLGAFIAIALIQYRSPLGLGDWPAFQSAGRALLTGGNPYLAHVPDGERTLCIYNPPWVLALTMPFSFLPLRLGWALLNATSFVLMLFIIRRLGASPLVLLISLPILYRATWTGNVDGFNYLSAALPAPIGLFFAALKPQNTLGLIAYWAYWNWREGGLRRLILTFAPLSVALAAGFAVYGPWYQMVCPFTTSAHLELFPSGLPIGLAILAAAIASKRKYLALAASPFISPYFSYASIVLLTVWGLIALQDLARWLYRVGTLGLESLYDRRRSVVDQSPLQTP